MEKIIFEDTTLVEPAKVIINGTEHIVHDAVYNGGTDLNAEVFNTMQDNIENAINVKTKGLHVETITGLSLGANASYQLNLPENTLFVEPLVQGTGSDYSGGIFLTLGSAYTYVMNSDSQGENKGIWIQCNNNGLVSISNYRHSGNLVKGFRIYSWVF